jgi:RND family efflux transporter MFP subunit
VSASHQLALSPKASGEVVGIYVRPGQKVARGQLLVALDASDAQTALTDAKLSLETAELTYEKNTAPSTLALTELQAENGVTNAQTALDKAHDDAYASIASVYSDLSSILTGLDATLHGYSTTNKTQQNIDVFADSVSAHDDSIGVFRNSAQVSYAAAQAAYASALASYKATSRSATNDELIALAQTTYQASQAVADAVKNAHDFFDRIQSDYTAYNLGSSSSLSTLAANVAGYTATVNGDLSASLTDKTNLVSAEQSLAVAQNTLQTTKAGATALTVQSATLDLKKAQEAVASAQKTLSNYYVYAPFSGTVASVPVQLYDSASSGTTVATLVTPQKTVEISVNEIDASKIEAGQKATITFDALPDIQVAGTVASVNTIGSASSGVVSYDAVVAFDTDNEQVLPGMSATVDIITGSASGLVVPASAVKSSGGRSYVQVFTPPLPESEALPGATSEALPTQMPVETGLTDDSQTIITGGLTGGEQVVSQTITGTSAKAATQSAGSLFGGGTRTTGTPVRGTAAPANAVFIRGG